MKRKDLEARRLKIAEFFNCLQEQVNAGILSRDMAREIARHEYGSKSFAQLVGEIDEQLAQMPSSPVASPRRRRNIHLAALAMVFVLGFGFAWYSGQLTGLFTFSDEEFYTYDFAAAYTSDDIAVLNLYENTSSVRANGQISGTGTATVWLQSGTQRYLLATFDPEEESSLLTGLFTAVTDIVSGSDDANSTELNSTNETADNDSVVVLNETMPLTPAPPAEEEIPLFAVKNLDNTCIESCNIVNATTPFMLIIDIEGDATVRIDSLVYGARTIVLEPSTPIETPVEEPIEEPVQEVPDTPDPAAPRPDSETVIPADLLATGALCAEDDDCTSGICKADRFQGSAVPARCVPQESYCVAATVVAPGTAVADSTCYAAKNSIWLASPGNGRYEIENVAGAVVAIVDKYGNMAITGDASFSTPVRAVGWVMESSTGTPTLSIDGTGNLVAAGSLVEQTSPAPTAGNDFIVKSNDGTLRAVFTESGSVQLAGVFRSDAELQ